MSAGRPAPERAAPCRCPATRPGAERQRPRPRGRPPAGEGPHQAAHRVRRHRRAGRRRRPARAARPRSVERPRRSGSECSRNERSPTAGSRAIRGTSACSSWRTPDPDFFEVQPGLVLRSVAERSDVAHRPRGRERARADRARDERGEARVRPARRAPALPARHPREERAALGRLSGRSSRPRNRGASDEEQKVLRNQAHRLASDLYQVAVELASANELRDRRPDRPERELVCEPAQPLHRRRGGGDRSGTTARARSRVVRDRADPADRLPAGGDRVGRLLRARRRHEPRRARRARRQRQPDERRARSPLPRARGGEPAQVGVPGEHVARAPDAAERDPRVLAGAARGDVRRAQREAEGVRRRHPRVGTPPALAHQRRPRPLEGRGRAGGAREGAVLAARGARERRRHGARAGDRGRRPHRAVAPTRTSASSRATSAGSGR